MSDNEGGDIPEAKVRKPRPRGRSPHPSETKSNATTSTHKKKEHAKSPNRLPTNPTRAAAAAAAAAAANSSSPSKERPIRHHTSSPKRSENGEGGDPTTGTTTTEPNPTLKKRKEKSPTRTRAPTGKGGDSPMRKRGESPNRIVGGDSPTKRRDSPNRKRGDSPIRKRGDSPTNSGESPNRKEGRGHSPDHHSRKVGKKKPPESDGRVRSTSPKKGKPRTTKKPNEEEGPAEQQQQQQQQQQSIELPMDNETEQSEDTPQFVTRKGNSTHLQLDLSKIRAGSGEMPVFSLLDEDSLLGASTDDEGSRANSPKRSTAQPKDSLLDTTKPQQKSTQHSNEIEFTPWGFDDDQEKEETHPKKGPLGFSLSPKCNSPKGNRSLSPTGIRRAVKAFKYTKPTMSGASDFVEKLSSGFQQRMGFAPHHQQMDDEDDLAELL